MRCGCVQGYEPYVLLARRFTPWYDERFAGYGWDKIQHLLHVHGKRAKALVPTGQQQNYTGRAPQALQVAMGWATVCADCPCCAACYMLHAPPASWTCRAHSPCASACRPRCGVFRAPGCICDPRAAPQGSHLPQHQAERAEGEGGWARAGGCRNWVGCRLMQYM